MTMYGSAYSSPSMTKAAMSGERKANFKAQLVDQPDFRIIIDCYTWLVHSKHLPTSGFFKRILAGPFLESESKSVTLHDDDPRNVVRLIIWLYYDAYSVSATRNNFGGPSVNEMITFGQEQYKALPQKLQKFNQPPKFLAPPLYDEDNSVHSAMYMLADKYDITELRKYCLDQFHIVCLRDPPFVWSLEDFKIFLTKQCIKAEDVEALVEEQLISKPMHYLKHPKLKAKVEAKPNFAWKLIEKLGEDAGHMKRKSEYGF